MAVDDVPCEFRWEYPRKGLGRLFLLKKLRQNALLERGFQPGEKRGFLGIDLYTVFVTPSRMEREPRAYLHATHDTWVLIIKY